MTIFTLSTKNRKRNKNKGFTVMELIVVITIFVLMSGISFFNYGLYQERIETKDLAQDIALTLRQAQVYGISASQRNIGSEEFDDIEKASEFFDTNGGTVTDITNDHSIRGVALSLDDQKLILFEDVNRNYHFDDSDRIIDERLVRYSRTKMKYFDNCDSHSCTRVSEGWLNITFERPYPDAIISYQKELSGGGFTRYNRSTIIIEGRSETQAGVEVNAIGNIVVK